MRSRSHREDVDEPLATLFPDLDSSGEFVVNDGIIEWNKEEDTFQALLDRVNSNSDSNVLTQVETTSDPVSGETLYAWRIDANEISEDPNPTGRPRGQLHRRLRDQNPRRSRRQSADSRHRRRTDARRTSRLDHPGGGLGPTQPLAGPTRLLGTLLCPGRWLHLLLHVRDLPAAEPGRKPAEAGRLYPRHQAGSTNARTTSTVSWLASPGRERCSSALSLWFRSWRPSSSPIQPRSRSRRRAC